MLRKEENCSGATSNPESSKVFVKTAPVHRKLNQWSSSNVEMRLSTGIDCQNSSSVNIMKAPVICAETFGQQYGLIKLMQGLWRGLMSQCRWNTCLMDRKMPMCASFGLWSYWKRIGMSSTAWKFEGKALNGQRPDHIAFGFSWFLCL